MFVTLLALHSQTTGLLLLLNSNGGIVWFAEICVGIFSTVLIENVIIDGRQFGR